MAGTVKVDGKTLHARSCTANEWFDAHDLENTRDQDYTIVSLCIVDKDSKPVFTPEDVGNLPFQTYSKLYALVLEANLPPKDAEKN